MKALKKILRDYRTLVFLDFEGTQLSHEIIAIGAQKVHIDEFGNIIEENIEGFHRYVKAKNSIGRIVEEMTKIKESTLKENGISFEQMLNEFVQYIGEPIKQCLFLTFGSNDARMIQLSIECSKPSNFAIGQLIMSQIFDFMFFINQYVKDDQGNSYSLVNYLKYFNVEPIGEAHDPLNDARNLKSLYSAFNSNKDLVLESYKKILLTQKIYPEPVKKVIKKLLSDQVVQPKEFNDLIKDFLS